MGRNRRKPSSPKPGRHGIPDILYPTLDLHGLSADEAARHAQRWIGEQHRTGEPVVRIITGRGKHSIGPPVLPDVLETLLGDLRTSTVESYEREPGGGAYRIRLKRPSTMPSLRRPSVRLPPDVVRLAEEALSELGIESTPALVDAEARRIIAEREREIL